MKSIRLIALSALLTIGSFCAVTYTSCTKDECKSVTCLNGGTCSGGSCTCPTGWLGSSCQTKAIIGSWKGTDVCDSNTYTNITVRVDPSTSDTTKVLIYNLGNFGGSISISGTLSSDAKTVTFTNQPISTSVSTTGTINLTSNTAFTLNYSVTDATSTDRCSGNYTKQ